MKMKRIRLGEIPTGTSVADLKEQAVFAARMAEDYKERKKPRLASVWRTTATRLRQELLRQSGAKLAGFGVNEYGFPEYFDADGMTIREVVKRVKEGDKANSKVVMVPTSELASIRDYEWSRTNIRRGAVPVGKPDSKGCPRDYSDPLEGPERWDALVKWTKKYGWKCDPAHVDVGRDGKAKLGEGNHRLAVAEHLGIERVPVQFWTVDAVRKTAERSKEPRQLAGLPRKGRIPAAQVKRALKALGAKVKKCGITAAALREGMEVEREHWDLTGGALKKTAKVAAAHLCERPDYYKRLKRYVER